MLTGRCECGTVKYQVDGEVHDYSHCHCSQCRRLHGAAFVSFAGIERSDFHYLAGEDRLSSYASSEKNTRVFCRNCGAHILVKSALEPDALYLAMGTVDGNPDLPSGYHIFVGSKAPWYKFEDSSPRYQTEPEDDD